MDYFPKSVPHSQLKLYLGAFEAYTEKLTLLSKRQDTQVQTRQSVV